MVDVGLVIPQVGWGVVVVVLSVAGGLIAWRSGLSLFDTK